MPKSQLLLWFNLVLWIVFVIAAVLLLISNFERQYFIILSVAGLLKGITGIAEVWLKLANKDTQQKV